MNTYWIQYGDRNGETGEITPIGTWQCKASDMDEAMDKFDAANDDDGYIKLRIAVAHKDGTNAAHWHTFCRAY